MLIAEGLLPENYYVLVKITLSVDDDVGCKIKRLTETMGMSMNQLVDKCFIQIAAKVGPEPPSRNFSAFRANQKINRKVGSLTAKDCTKEANFSDPYPIPGRLNRCCTFSLANSNVPYR